MSPPPSLGRFVIERGQHVVLRSGQSLFHEGDASSCVYACVRGRICLFVSTPAGREVTLGVKEAGDGFGELSAIDGAPRSATARAIEPSVVAQLSGAEFLDAVEVVPSLAIAVLRELAEHLRRTANRVSARSSQSTTQRVGHVLIELTLKFRRHGDASGPTTLPITQDELAAWVDSTREATARALAVFRRAGAVSTGRNKITIVDDDALLVAMRGSHG